MVNAISGPRAALSGRTMKVANASTQRRPAWSV